MVKKSFFIITTLLLAVILISACGRSSDGFKTTSSGLKYKFHVKGEKDTLNVNLYDIVYVRMDYRVADTMLFQSGVTPISFQVKPGDVGDLQEGLLMMKVGDSATFAMPAEKFFINLMKYKEVPAVFRDYAELYVDIKVVALIPEPQALKDERAAAEVRKATEQDIIKKYIEEQNITVQPTANGLYYIEIVKGKGKKAEAGNRLKVHYKGLLFDGEVFDSSYDRNKPVTFTLGNGERLPAWDEGFALMAAGGNARFIVPSALGYGAEQRSKVKPYTPLIFEVELLEVTD